MTADVWQRRQLAALRFVAKVRKKLRDRIKDSNRVYVAERVGQYRTLWQTVSPKVNATFTELSSDTWRIQRGRQFTHIVNSKLEFDNPAVLAMAGDKPLMHRLLKDSGLPVPDCVLVRMPDLSAGMEFLGRHPLGLAVKPPYGAAALGVSTHIETEAQLREAAVLASLYDDEVLIEAMIPGECYRLLVVEGKLLNAMVRRGARVTGDGKTSIAGLIERENARRTDMGEPALTVDRNCLFTLRWQGLKSSDVLENERVALIKTIPEERNSTVELRTVYDQDVTETIGSPMREVAEAAARVIGGEFIGVDIITPDALKPLHEVGGAINEINTTPALHHHYDFRKEPYPRVAIEVLDRLLKRSERRD